VRTAAEGKRLFFTDSRHLYRFRKHFQRDLEQVQNPHWLHFEDTDHAVEWCENELIANKRMTSASVAEAADLSQQYLCASMTPAELEALRNAGEERRFAAGTQIFGTGDPAHCLYFIFSGEVEVSVDTDSGHPLRLTTLGPGMVFGEVALLNRNRRTANVIASADTSCLEVAFNALPDAVRTKMLVNMASYFAGKIAQDTALVQHLG
jgi:glutaminase